jgi:hypothetical protein
MFAVGWPVAREAWGGPLGLLGVALTLCVVCTSCGGRSLSGRCESNCAPPIVDADLDAGDDGAPTSGPDACVAAGGQCGEGGVDAGACTYFEASSYDQTCVSDSDCTKVFLGNACEPCPFICGAEGVAAINKKSAPRYWADVNKTAASGAMGLCNCPPDVASYCCRGGRCVAGDRVCSPPDGSAGLTDE